MTEEMDGAAGPLEARLPGEEGLLPYEIDPAAPLAGEEGDDREAARTLAN